MTRVLLLVPGVKSSWEKGSLDGLRLGGNLAAGTYRPSCGEGPEDSHFVLGRPLESSFQQRPASLLSTLRALSTIVGSKREGVPWYGHGGAAGWGCRGTSPCLLTSSRCSNTSSAFLVKTLTRLESPCQPPFGGNIFCQSWTGCSCLRGSRRRALSDSRNRICRGPSRSK